MVINKVNLLEYCSFSGSLLYSSGIFVKNVLLLLHDLWKINIILFTLLHFYKGFKVRSKFVTSYCAGFCVFEAGKVLFVIMLTVLHLLLWWLQYFLHQIVQYFYLIIWLSSFYCLSNIQPGVSVLLLNFMKESTFTICVSASWYILVTFQYRIFVFMDRVPCVWSSVVLNILHFHST